MQMDQNLFYDEILNKLNVMGLAIEDARSNPDDMEKINELFRSIHTIKGIANLMFFFEIEALSHKAEDLLDEVRKKKIVFSSSVADLFLEFKKFLVVLVDEKLDGLDMDDYEQDLYSKFEKEFLLYMPFTILVLDRSLELKEKVIEVAEDRLCKVVTASSLYDAQQELQKNNVKLLMVDTGLDELQGIDFMEYVTGHVEFKFLPLILLSDSKNPQLIEYGKKFHAKAWLLRDFQEYQLDVVLEKFIK